MSATEMPPIDEKMRAVWAVADIANELNMYRGLDDGKYITAAHMEYARMAVNAVAGQPIVGNTVSSKYYEFRVPVYEQRNIGMPPYFGHRFEGIIKRIVNAPVRKTDDRVYRQVCLQVAPLEKGVGTEWVDHYEQRGWDARLRHPFADTSKAGKSVWIPLGTLGEYQILFPGDPSAAQYAVQRVPAWHKPRFE